MIAVAVTLSIALLVMINILRDDTNTEDPVLIGFNKESDTSQLRVVVVNKDLDWFDHVRFTGTCTPTLNGAVFPSASGTPVAPGDLLGCAPGEALNVIAVQDTDSSIVYQATFS